MKILCDCGTELELLPPENEKGFMLSRAVCPTCGQEYILRLTKSRKIRL